MLQPIPRLPDPHSGAAGWAAESVPSMSRTRHARRAPDEGRPGLCGIQDGPRVSDRERRSPRWCRKPKLSPLEVIAKPADILIGEGGTVDFAQYRQPFADLDRPPISSDGLNPETGAIRNQFQLGVRGDPQCDTERFRDYKPSHPIYRHPHGSKLPLEWEMGVEEPVPRSRGLPGRLNRAADVKPTSSEERCRFSRPTALGRCPEIRVRDSSRELSCGR